MVTFDLWASQRWKSSGGVSSGSPALRSEIPPLMEVMVLEPPSVVKLLPAANRKLQKLQSRFIYTPNHSRRLNRLFIVS